MILFTCLLEFDRFLISSLFLEISAAELSILMTPFDLKRLDSYANNQLDYHVILDLLPTVATLYFEKRLGPEVHLSAVQSSILLAIGLQRKTIEEVEVRHSLLSIQTSVLMPACLSFLFL